MRRLLLTLALAAGFAGCGGDDALSTGEYRSELRKICAQSDREEKGIEAPTRLSREAIVDYLSRLRAINEDTVGRIEKLEPPEELRDEHDRALAASREGRKPIDAMIARLEEGGDPAEVLSQARGDLRKATEATAKAAQAVGVPECGD